MQNRRARKLAKKKNPFPFDGRTDMWRVPYPLFCSTVKNKTGQVIEIPHLKNRKNDFPDLRTRLRGTVVPDRVRPVTSCLLTAREDATRPPAQETPTAEIFYPVTNILLFLPSSVAFHRNTSMVLLLSSQSLQILFYFIHFR